MYGNQKYFANMDGLQARLGRYNNRGTQSVITSFKFWLYHMSRSDRKAWNARGVQLLKKIEETGFEPRDKNGLNNFINYAMDKEEAFYLTGNTRKHDLDDEYSS